MDNNSNKATKSSDDLIFEYIYVTSMRDATLQLSYKSKKAWLTKSEYINGENDCFKRLRQFVDNVLDNRFESQQKYDNELLNLAKVICDKINKDAEGKGIDINKEETRFTFGNAQKLINMIIKNYYICTYNNSSLKDRFKYCHCPMDRQLLVKVWNNYKTEFSKKPSIKCNTQDDFSKSWGSLDFDNGNYPERYNEFQEAVSKLAKKKNISRLEYDFKEWNNN